MMYIFTHLKNRKLDIKYDEHLLINLKCLTKSEITFSVIVSLLIS